MTIFVCVVTEACMVRGEPVAAGVHVDLPGDDAINLLSSGRGELRNPNDAEALREWQYEEVRKINGYRTW
jgi:hypothetical protein